MTVRGAGKTYEEANWDKLSPKFRAAHNRLRQARGLPPIPPPKVDNYKPPPDTGMIRELTANDARAAMAEIGEPNEAQQWMGIAERLALNNAQRLLQKRKLRTDNLYHAIARFVVLSMHNRGWPRKVAIYEAASRFKVKERTVEEALAKEKKRNRAMTKAGFRLTIGIAAACECAACAAQGATAAKRNSLQ
jgi:hypothetical protein